MTTSSLLEAVASPRTLSQGVYIMNDVSKVTTAPAPERATTNPVGWLRNEIDRLFDDFSFGRPPRSIFNFPTSLETLRPAADLVDDGKAYRLSIELPGLKQEDIDIEYAEGMLTISGEKKEESERKENGRILNERCFGSFRRQMSLPGDIAPDGIKADYKDGVLILTLAKDENAAIKPRKIHIG
jgi:HSP20 family protein